MYIEIYRNGVHANVNENWDDETKDREFKARSFYAPRKKQGKFHTSEEDFVDTVKRVFAQGGGYPQVASELGLTPSAVYTRANKLRKDGINLPVTTQTKGVAEDAVKILSELGVEVEYTPVKVANGSADEAKDILKELGYE
jgi:DNA invertase Pin-like site-specific DNA recombinase